MFFKLAHKSEETLMPPNILTPIVRIVKAFSIDFFYFIVFFQEMLPL